MFNGLLLFLALFLIVDRDRNSLFLVDIEDQKSK